MHFLALIMHLIFPQIPNPLFDLAGITCGHFLVPFWTFFGATLIGKALIKMHIQVSDIKKPPWISVAHRNRIIEVTCVYLSVFVCEMFDSVLKQSITCI